MSQHALLGPEVERLQVEYKILKDKLQVTKRHHYAITDRIKRERSRNPSTTYGERIITMCLEIQGKIRDDVIEEQKELQKHEEHMNLQGVILVSDDTASVANTVSLITPSPKKRNNYNNNVTEKPLFPSSLCNNTQTPCDYLQMKTPLTSKSHNDSYHMAQEPIPFAQATPKDSTPLTSKEWSYDEEMTEERQEMKKQANVPMTNAACVSPLDPSIVNKEDEDENKSHELAPTVSISDCGESGEESEEDSSSDTETDLESLSAAQRMDRALSKYYHHMGCDYYENEDDERNKEGPFAQWLEECGFDDDGIEDELGADAEESECTFCAFDDDFPLTESTRTRTEDEKQSEIFRVLQHLYLHGFDLETACRLNVSSDFYPTKLFMCKYMNNDLSSTKAIDFGITQRDLAETKKIYHTQGSKVFYPKLCTSDLHYGFAIGVKNGCFPFLQYFIDALMRKRLQFVLRDVNRRTFSTISVADFLDESMESVGDHTLNKAKIVESVESYWRVCAMMPFTKLATVINDDLEAIIEYLIIVNHIIMNEIIKKNRRRSIVPFQFDVTIACNGVNSTETICNPKFSDDDDDEDSDSDDEMNENVRNEDKIGNVENKLNSNRLKNINVTLSAIRKPKDIQKLTEMDASDADKLFDVSLDACRRKYGIQVLCEGTKEFKWMEDTSFRSKHYKKFCDCMSRLRLCLLKQAVNDIAISILFEIVDFEMCCDDINQWICDILDENRDANYFDSNKEKMVNAYHQFARLHDDESFPYKRRMNLFIDRRSNNYQQETIHNYCDNVIFYECPQGSNRLPSEDQIVSECFVNLTQKCIIPKLEYSDNENINEAVRMSHMQATERTRYGTISSMSPVSNLLTFSFHVISADIIKCYMYRDLQFTRFLPQDIKHILPHLFNPKYGRNQDIMEDEEKILEMISKMNFHDKLFDSWFTNRRKSTFM